ncbi:hypothetical protein, partial [Yersinia enterocolitica]
VSPCESRTLPGIKSSRDPMPKAWGFCYVGNKKTKKEPSAEQRAFFMYSLKTKYNMSIMIG